MRNERRKVKSWKRMLARFMVVTLLAGNISDLCANVAYASEVIGAPDYAGAVESVTVNQADIEAVLAMDEAERPVLDESLIPFERAAKREKTRELIQEQIGDSILVDQGVKSGCMYLVFVEKEGASEKLADRIRIIGINGDTEKECRFRIQLVGTQLNAYEAKIEQFKILGEEDLLPETESTAVSTEESTASAEESTASAEESTASAEESTASAEESTASAEESTAPAEESTASAEESTAPAEESTASVEESTTPAEESTTRAKESTTRAKETAVSTEEVPVKHESELQSESSINLSSQALISKSIHDVKIVMAPNPTEKNKKAEITEPEITEPEITEPEVTEPEVTEPEVTESKEMIEESQESTLSQETSSSVGEADDSAELESPEKSESESELETSMALDLDDEAYIALDQMDGAILDDSPVEITPYGEEKTLEQTELDQLMGKKSGRSRSAASMGYELIMPTNGIAVITAEISEYESPFTMADKLYKDTEGNPNSAVFAEDSLAVNQIGGDDIERGAGESGQFTLSYQLNPSALYEYASGNWSLYEGYDSVKIYLDQIPEGLKLSSKTSGIAVSGPDQSGRYSIDMGTRTSGNIVINAEVKNKDKSSNNLPKLGTVFTIAPSRQIWIEAGFTVSDRDRGETQKYTNKAFYDAGGNRELTIEVTSKDKWAVQNTNMNLKTPWKEVDGKAELQYFVQVGLESSGGKPTTSPGDYSQIGRAVFTADSFQLIYTLTYPVVDGKTVAGTVIQVKDHATGKILDKDKWKVRDNEITITGFQEDDMGFPFLSEYEITVQYPLQDLTLDFDDARIDDKTLFETKGSAALTYELASVDGKAKPMTTQSEDVIVPIKKLSMPYGLTIIKKVQTPTEIGGSLSYNKVFREKYPEFTGSAEFRILNEDGSVYTGAKQFVNGSYETIDPKNGIIKIGEEDLDRTTVFVKPGKYNIEEITAPQNMNRDTESKPVKFEASKSGNVSQSGTVTFTNTSSMGGLRFQKMVKNSEGKTTALSGAKFTLTSVTGDKIYEATSDSKGTVTFYPVKSGTYTLTEEVTDTYIRQESREITINNSEITKITDIINIKNEAELKVTKQIVVYQEDGTESLVPIPYDMDGRDQIQFQVEQSQTDPKNSTGEAVAWKTLEKYGTIKLNGDSTFSVKGLPIYWLDGTTQKNYYYRIKETAPKGYSGGAGTYQESQNPGFIYQNIGSLKDTNITEATMLNVHNGILELTKYTTQYKEDSGKVEDTITPGVGFRLYKSDGVDVTLVNDTIYMTTDQGVVKADDLPVIQDGKLIQYYWQEVDPAANTRLYYGTSGTKKPALTISGQQNLIGPYTVASNRVVRDHAYNVFQQRLILVKKTDALTKLEITGDDLKNFKFTVKGEGEETLREYGNLNAAKVLQVDSNKAYTITETNPPSNYYADDASKTISADSSLVSYEALHDINQIQEVIIADTPYQKVMLNKLVKGTNEGVTSYPNNIKFNVYRRNGAAMELVPGEILSNTATPLMEGEYYFEEQWWLANVINPFNYMENGKDGMGITTGPNSTWYWGPYTVGRAVEEGLKEVQFPSTDTSFTNYASARTITVKKVDDRDHPVAGAKIGLYNSSGTIMQTKTTDQSGIATFDQVPLYAIENSTSAMVYTVREIEAPAGYLFNEQGITFRLDPEKSWSSLSGTTVLLCDATTKVPTGEEAPLQIVNERKITIRANKYKIDGWQNQFDPDSAEIAEKKYLFPDVSLALYKKAADGNYHFIEERKTSAEDGSAVFGAGTALIGTTGTYTVIEAEIPVGYRNKEGVVKASLTRSTDGKLPEILGSDLSSYNYADVDVAEIAAGGQKTIDLFNKKSWMQLNITKIATQKKTYGTNGEPPVITPLSPEEQKPVNDCRFTLYRSKNMQASGVLDFAAINWDEIGNYESGTKLEKLSGDRVEGQFVTNILEDGYVYWLKETLPAYGYELGDRAEYTVFVPGEESEYATAIENSKVNIIQYETGAVTSAEVDNYLIEANGSEDGKGSFVTNLKLNKWLEKGDKSYTPLGGVTYHLYLADQSGQYVRDQNGEKILFDTLTTGLDSKAGEITGQVMSRHINLTKGDPKSLWEELKSESYGLTEAQIESLVQIESITSGSKESLERRSIHFILQEVSAPEKIVIDPKEYPVIAVTNQGMAYREYNTQYFWTDGGSGKRLINQELPNYMVTINSYGYTPVFGEDGLESEGARRDIKSINGGFMLEKSAYQDGDGNYVYVPYTLGSTGNQYTFSQGKIVFKDGLPLGKYRLTLKWLDFGYSQLYNGKNDAEKLNRNFVKEFTVSGNEVIDLYNPAKPKLSIQKTTAAGAKSLEGIQFQLRGRGNAAMITDKTGFAINSTMLNSGNYTITESVKENKSVSDVYWMDYPVAKTTYVLGYEKFLEEGIVKLKRRTVQSNQVYLSGFEETGVPSITAYNPRKGNLTVKKISDDNSTPLQNAEFEIYFKKFIPSYSDGTLSYLTGEENKPNSSDSGWKAIVTETKLTTDANGEINIAGADPGWYKIHEKKAPQGYSLAQDQVIGLTCDLGADGESSYRAEVTVTDEKYLELQVKKVLDYGTVSMRGITPENENIVFDVMKKVNGTYSELNPKVSMELTGFTATGKPGQYEASASVFLPQLEAGESYSLKEREETDWFLTDSGSYHDIEGNFTDYGIIKTDVTNRYAKAEFAVLKVDGFGNPLTGAEFKLYNSDRQDSEPIAIAAEEPAGSGIYWFHNIPIDHKTGSATVYYEETKAPEMYVRNQERHAVTLKPGDSKKETLVNELGMDLRLYKVDNTYASPEKSPLEGAEFDLYYRQDSGEWKVWSGGTTGAEGTLIFKGIPVQPGRSYAIKERPFDKNSNYYKYRLESVFMEGEKLTAAEGLEGAYLLPSRLSTDQTYQLDAYNSPAATITIKKQALGGVGTATAKFEIYQGENQLETVTTAAIGGEGFSSARIVLEPGEYTIKEVEAVQGGYPVKIDQRVIWQKEIQVAEGGAVLEKQIDGAYVKVENQTLNFTNLNPEFAFALEKNVVNTELLKSLVTTTSQPLTFRLGIVGAKESDSGYIKTGKPKNDLPLAEFKLVDSGLRMFVGAEEVPAADLNYAITSIAVGSAAYSTDNLKLGETLPNPQVMAQVTVYKQDRSSAEYVIAAGETLTLSAQDGYRDFDISYYDPNLLALTGNRYALGQNFTPGEVSVSMILNQQKTAEGAAYQGAITGVVNEASIDAGYYEWSLTGEENQNATRASGTDLASVLTAQAEIGVAEPDVPVIKVTKTVTPEGNFSDHKVQPVYTLTLNNVGSTGTEAAVMRSPVLVDRLPDGLDIITDGMGGGFGLAKTTYQLSGPKGITLNDDEVKISQDEKGRRYVILPLTGDLAQGETVSIQFKTEINGSIINYSSNIENKLFVTSAVKSKPFASNIHGATFKIQNGEGSTWPIQQDEDADLEAAVKNFYPDFGYATSVVRNQLGTEIGDIALEEAIKGNKDNEYLYGQKIAGRAGNNGSVNYRLLVTNVTADMSYTDLRVVNILPYPQDADYNGNSRYSAWGVTGDEIERIMIEDPKTGARTTIDSNQYDLYYRTGNTTEIKSQSDSYMKYNSDTVPDGWTKAAGKSITGAQAFMVNLHGITVEPGENLVIEVKTEVGDKTQQLSDISFKYATNNFTLGYRFKSQSSIGSEIQTNHMTTTSNAVNTTLEPEDVKVGGRIWIDDNHDGVRNDSSIVPDQFFGAFDITLNRYQGLSQSTSVSAKPKEDGSFLFEKLAPASPNPNSRVPLYDTKNELNPKALMTDSPSTYRINIKGRPDLTSYGVSGIEVTEANRKAPNTVNEEPGRSRKPSELTKNYLYETQDSNYKGTVGASQSERFFLWADEGAGISDQSKDLGLVLYRDLKITKKNSAGGMIPGTQFDVYGPYTQGEAKKVTAEDLSKPILTGITDADGIVKIPKLLYHQEYIIVEKQASPGYTIEGAESNLENTVTVDGKKAWILPYGSLTEEGKGYNEVTVTDAYKTGTLEFTKIDGTDKTTLPGAEFSLSRDGSKPEFSGLNSIWSSYINQLKTDSKAQETANIEVLSVENDIIRYKATTGKVKLENLPYGNYTLTETAAPEHYFLLTGGIHTYSFSLDDNNQAAVLMTEAGSLKDNIIVNNRAEYGLKLQKKDSSGKPMEGVTFTLEGPGAYRDGIFSIFNSFKTSGDTGSASASTNAMGILEIASGLTYGDYKITEQVPDGYEEIKPFYIRISKSGEVSLLQEMEGVVLGSPDQEGIDIIVTNRVKEGSLYLEKVDSENPSKGLNGVEFTLEAKSTRVTGAWEEYKKKIGASGIELIPDTLNSTSAIRFRIDGTYEAGKAILPKLPYGEYVLTETKSPEGYLIPKEPVRSFTIDEEHKKIEFTRGLLGVGGNPITNDPHQLTVVKAEEQSEHIKLAGAVFILQRTDGQYITLEGNSFTGFTSDAALASEFQTGEGGTVTLKRLPAGTYRLIEKKAPENYQINGNIPDLVIDSTQNQSTVVTDLKIRGDGGGRGTRPEGGGTVPGGPGARVTIIPDQVPLASLPIDGTPSGMVAVIDDGNIPLAALPKTGEHKAVSALLMLISGMMLMAYTSMSKRKKQE